MMKNKKMTHTGVFRGSDARTNKDWGGEEFLRETKNYWVTQYGLKYHKLDGRGIGDWPLYHLDLETIKPIS